MANRFLFFSKVIFVVGPVSGVGQHADFHGSSSDDADDPSSRGSTRPNSAHDEEQVNKFDLLMIFFWLLSILTRFADKTKTNFFRVRGFVFPFFFSICVSLSSSIQIYYFIQGSRIISAGRQLDDIQYLDLDLESDSSLQSPKSPERGHHHQNHHQASSTVYKTVDFIKTEAFNRTRLTVEERRSKKAQ